MDIATRTGLMFGGFTVGGACLLMFSTYMKCSKYNVSNAFKNGAIMASFPSIAFGLASFIEVIRNPFIHFFQGFGIEENLAYKLGIGYIMILFLWPGTIWGIMNSETAACVATTDEMTEFKTKMLAKLQEKQKQEAKDVAPPPKTS